MSAFERNPNSDALRAMNIDQLLAHNLQQDRAQTRLRRIARMGELWDHRKTLGKCAVWGAAIALLVAILIPSRYASTTRLMPPDPPNGQGMAILAGIASRAGVGSNAGALGGDLLGLKSSADLFAGILLSRTIQNSLITKFDLRGLYGQRKWIDARKELTRRTDVSIDRKSGILTIQVTDHDPGRARAMAQEYVAELNQLVTQLNTSAAHRERVFLEGRLDQVRIELESAEKDFSQFSSKNGAIDIKEQGKSMVEAAAVLEGQLIAAQTQLQGLRQIFTDQNIRVREAQARVEELRRQFMKIGGKQESLDESPSGKEDEVYPSIRKLPLLGVTYADLYRRMKIHETVFETLTQQYEIAKVQEAKEVPSVKVLDPAELPEKKVFPPRTLLTLFGGLLALVLGACWVITKHGWTRIDPQDPRKILVLRMVGSVRPQLDYLSHRPTFISAFSKKVSDPVSNNPRPVESD